MGTQSGRPQYETAPIVPTASSAKIAAAQVHSLSGLRRRRNGGAASNCDAPSGSARATGGPSIGGGGATGSSGRGGARSTTGSAAGSGSGRMKRDGSGDAALSRTG